MLARVQNALTPRRSRTLFDSPFDRLFDDVLTDWRYFDRAPSRSVPNYSMRVDDEGLLRCEVELPGVSSEDLEITVEAGVIGIKGSRGEVEFSYRFTPSADYDLDTAEAQIKDGLLTIKVAPYARPEPRKIPLIQG